MAARWPWTTHAIAFYAAVGLGFFALLAWTLIRQPLFPLQPSNAAWASAWLFTTVCDYYASTFCLCGVILATEGLLEGVVWSLACCLLGSPFGCAWVISRLWKHGTIAITDLPPRRY